MTQDEHDAKCWRLVKAAIVESKQTLSVRAKEMASELQSLMASAEVRVDAEAH